MPRLLDLIDDLTNWYIRFNRSRLKGSSGSGSEDNICALNTLFEVLFILVRGLAPFIPFLTDHIYSLLTPYLPEDFKAQATDIRSVHFLAFPEVREELFDQDIERSVRRMRKVIDLTRIARERRAIGLKAPLEMLVVIANPPYLDDLRSLQTYICDELNVRRLLMTSDESSYSIQLSVVANFARLGKRLKKDLGKVQKAILGLTNQQIKQFLEEKVITVEGISLDNEDITVIRGLSRDNDPSGKWETISDNEVLILLDTDPGLELKNEGVARDLISRVQKMRKKAGLVPTDAVRMDYRVLHNQNGVDFAGIIQTHEATIEKILRGGLEEQKAEVVGDHAKAQDVLILEEEQVIQEATLLLRLLRV